MKLKQEKKPTKQVYIGIKTSEEEKAQIQHQADKYAEGNVSLWIRFAALHFEPKKEHLEGEKK